MGFFIADCQKNQLLLEKAYCIYLSGYFVLFCFVFVRIRKYLSDYSSWVISTFMALYLYRNIISLTNVLAFQNDGSIMINWETDFTEVRIAPGPCPEKHAWNKGKFPIEKTVCILGTRLLCRSSAMPR